MGIPFKKLESDKARGFKRARCLVPAKTTMRGVYCIGVIMFLLFFLVGCSTLDSSSSQPADAPVISIIAPSHAAIEVFAEANGVLYLASSNEVLAARQESDGKLLWSQPLPFASHHSFDYLAAAGNILYDAYNEPTFAIVEARQGNNGSLLWKRQVNLLGPLPLKASDNVLYVNTRHGLIYTFNSSDGRLLWKYAAGRTEPMDGFLYSLGENVAILSNNGTVHILNAQNGTQVLSYQSAGTEWWPAVANGILYVHPQNQPMQAYRLSDGSLLWSSTVSGLTFDAWTMDHGTIYVLAGEEIKALGEQNGSLLWQISLGEGTIAGPMVQDQMIYTITQSGIVIALHTTNGAIAWKHQMKQLQFGSVSTALYPGLLLFRPETTVIIAWGSNTGEDTWQYHASAPIMWEPQEDKGILFIWKSDGTMDVLQSSTGTLLWRYLL